ncbi:MAG: hypothetical protein KDD25_09740 [Bdellovibrionales bacterium]|nr:hypothetical protein [Bdellovibrionales bacterium]
MSFSKLSKLAFGICILSGVFTAAHAQQDSVSIAKEILADKIKKGEEIGENLRAMSESSFREIARLEEHDAERAAFAELIRNGHDRKVFKELVSSTINVGRYCLSDLGSMAWSTARFTVRDAGGFGLQGLLHLTQDSYSIYKKVRDSKSDKSFKDIFDNEVQFDVYDNLRKKFFDDSMAYLAEFRKLMLQIGDDKPECVDAFGSLYVRIAEITLATGRAVESRVK